MARKKIEPAANGVPVPWVVDEHGLFHERPEPAGETTRLRGERLVKHIRPTTLSVYLALIELRDANGHVPGPKARIGRMLDCAASTINRHIARLEQLWLVQHFYSNRVRGGVLVVRGSILPVRVATEKPIFVVPVETIAHLEEVEKA